MTFPPSANNCKENVDWNFCKDNAGLGARDVYKRLQATISPFQTLPHHLQLKENHAFAERCSRKLANFIINCTSSPPEKFVHQAEKLDGLAYPVDPMRPSPVIEGCRNKDNFTIGRGVDGLPTVGYFLRPGKYPKLNVGSGKLRVQKQTHFDISTAFQVYLRSSSCCLPPWNHHLANGGYWKNLIVKSNRSGDIMVVGVINPRNISKTLIDTAKMQLIEFFTEGPGKEFNISSLYFQECPYMKCSDEVAPYQHLYGSTHIYETILNKKFRISPGSFFQVNPYGAEVLYETVRELSGVTQDTTLLDVCCGTGTIGILLSPHVKQVFGIELIQAAVNDAKVNAQLNGVRNIHWSVGKAEKMLGVLLQDNHLDTGEQDVVAVINPSRAGLGEKVLRALRSCKSIRKVIYISCNPSGRAHFNFTRLCQSPHQKKRLEEDPFIPTRAIPVDMFPDARHTELVVLFER